MINHEIESPNLDTSIRLQWSVACLKTMAKFEGIGVGGSGRVNLWDVGYG